MARTILISGWAFDVVDYDGIYVAFSWFQFQAKLILDGGEKREAGRVGRNSGARYLRSFRHLTWRFRRPAEGEIVFACESSSVSHAATKFGS